MGSTADIGIFTTDAALVVRTWDGWLADATGIARDDAIGRLVAVQAALALGEQHDAGAVPPLMDALRDPGVNVCFQAIESLGRLRAETAVDDLVGADPDPSVARAAVEGLAAFAGLATQDPSKAVRRAAATALARIRA